ncbi:hypothetical protein B0A55_05072 [Friedmanniomyces simplex]|uniref:Cation/H+ exchanger transmembrane domain-containing protein n=1 Tax=Friedmanniomyces simplex TaxID=329884 RepID=A0A4U0XE66_9PEZI|nr:hypothetical protein B0A55_05072 [Friedmanniomyces simplex]
MSGLMNKAKEAMGKSSGGGSGGSSSGGQESGTEKQADKYANQGIDKATDSAGMGDKYDGKIDQFALLTLEQDKQLNNQIPGGQGNQAGGQQGGFTNRQLVAAMGKHPTPPPPPQYRDDPDDAVSMHTTRSDYEYDDAQQLPSYSDSEAAAASSSSNTNDDEQSAPLIDDYAVIPSGSTIDLRAQSRSKVVTGGETTIRMDERLEDPEALHNYTNALSLLPPKIQVRIRGWHDETVNRNSKKETSTVVDFDMHFNLSQYLPRFPAEQGWQPYLVADGDLAHRGSWRKTRAENYTSDIEAGGERYLGLADGPHLELRRWITEYCESKAKLRVFRLTREVSGLDTEYLTNSVERLIRSTDYRGHTGISFPIADKNVDIYSPHEINRWRTSWIRYLFYFTFLWLITWPILFFLTKRWEVYRVRWCFSYMISQRNGQSCKRYSRISEEDWCAEHASLIRGLALDRFQGDATDLPLESGDTEERRRRGTVQTGNANLDAAASLIRDGLDAWNSVSVVDLLVIISFFTLLWVAQYMSAKVIRAGIIGPIIAGIIYGVPLANILLHEWQETFLALGYVGLILLIFEGGLTARLDLLRANLFFSVCAAITGIIFPIGLSYLLLYLGFGYGAVETFIIGAALSSTSLGTTFAVLSGASKTIDFSQTRVGAVLVSAAVIDDVSGLVMSSVIQNLGSMSDGGNVNLGWLIGRPIVASIAMAVVTPVLSKFVLAPVFRKFIQGRLARYGHRSNIVLMILVLCAFISIAAYSGTSVLFGAFLAGMLLTYLPTTEDEASLGSESKSESERHGSESLTFVHTFEHYVQDVQRYVLEPLFFASIGFAIPFLDLWTGSAIWHGIVYTLLMIVGKLVVGLWIPLWAAMSSPARANIEAGNRDTASPPTPQLEAQSRTRKSMIKAALSPGCLLGMAMVARGEIGLLIIQIGFNSTLYVSQAAFLTGIWAIMLNTIVGPVAVGALVKYRGGALGKGEWGLVPIPKARTNARYTGSA